ncbi:hypothetical protein BC827DRAFT_260091 [Russula dissimulans]|nr:hypothetical protein BC827DRAFT_260091 [Russula dissimulans]
MFTHTVEHAFAERRCPCICLGDYFTVSRAVANKVVHIAPRERSTPDQNASLKRGDQILTDPSTRLQIVPNTSVSYRSLVRELTAVSHNIWAAENLAQAPSGSLASIRPFNLICADWPIWTDCSHCPGLLRLCRIAGSSGREIRTGPLNNRPRP